MKHHVYFVLLFLVCASLLIVPLPLVAGQTGRAIDAASVAVQRTGPAAPTVVAAPSTAMIPEPSQPGTWHQTAHPPFDYARHDGAFVPGPDGEPWANKVYFLGGRTSPSTELPDIWMFDPVTLAYTDTGANVVEDVSNYNTNLILDDSTGRGPAVYVVGGTDKDSSGTSIGMVQRYYPQTNEAEALASADNWPGMVGGYRVAAMGTAVVDDVIYVFGGWQTNAAPYFSAETWRFDPRAPSGSRWTNLGTPMAIARSYLQSAVQNGKVYAIGGVSSYVGGELDPTDVVEVLDPANLAAGWTTLTAMPTAGGEGRAYGFDVDTLAIPPWQGKLYVVAPNDWPYVSSEVLEYDIAANTWRSDLPELPTPRADMAGSFIPLCTPDPDDGLPGLWTFGGRIDESCVPPLGPVEYYPLSCYSECSILLVDDDWDFDDSAGPNDGGRPYYTSTLDYLGFGYSVWDTVSMGTPTAADLAPYDAVIWFTGYDWETPISPTEELELSAYLDAGGSLLLSSQEQTYAFPASPFLADYMGVYSVTEDVTLLGTEGSPDDPIFAGLGPYPMTRPDQWAPYWPTGGDEGPYDDEVYGQPDVFEPLIYTTDGQPSATRYVSDTFETMYLAFPFEWMPDVENRAELLGRVLQEWLGCELPCIGLASLEIAGPADIPLGETAVYSVTAAPPNATAPIDLLWSSGATGASAAYTWTEPGLHTVVVTGTNCYGAAVVTATLDVLVTCESLTEATISGPVELAVGEVGSYEVTVQPPTATVPIELEWSNGSTAISTTYSWNLPGDYTVVVTATNCAGTSLVRGTLGVTVPQPLIYSYLPLVLKNP